MFVKDTGILGKRNWLGGGGRWEENKYRTLVLAMLA